MPYKFNPMTNSFDLVSAYAEINKGEAGEVLTSNGPDEEATFQEAGGGGALGLNSLLTAPDLWNMPNASGNTTYPIISDNLSLFPITLYSSIELSSIGIYVSVAAAGASGRVGIYEMDQSTAALSLVEDFGTFDASSTGIKTISVTTSLDASKVYIGAIVVDENGGSVSVFGMSGGPIFAYDSSTARQFRALSKASVGIGALAASYNYSDLSTEFTSSPIFLIK